MSINKIKIDSTTGGSDKNVLIGCYFEQSTTPGKYNFFGQNNRLLASNVSPSLPFLFHLNNWLWTIGKLTIDNQHAHGDWAMTRTEPDPAYEQEGGTFHAQAGGGVGEEVAQQNLVIFEITSDHGRDFGNALKGCYFSLTGGGNYRLRDPDGGVLHHEVKWNDSFRFQFEFQEWEITTDILTLEAKAHGRWKLLGGLGEEVDGGTYHAQAGGGANEEIASSAGAY
jgi:hypothetical protein